MADVKHSKLFHLDTGILKERDACIVLVKTEWNSEVVDELERGCRAELKKHGVTRLRTITVPGAFEIPFAVKNYWEQAEDNDKPDAFIAFGCVVRGDTPHFEYVCKAVTDGVLQLNLLLPVPTIFGILTVDDDTQAKERIGGRHGHKGEEAALTAIKMIILSSRNKHREPHD
jgi:6,7-dimethyl-8-ribityllumazine synthase